MAFVAARAFSPHAEPIILNGGMLPELIGAPVGDMRVLSASGKPLLFQIDERTPCGEYVCPFGERPNADSGDGLFSRQDEIVFLREAIDGAETEVVSTEGFGARSRCARCTVRHGLEERTVVIVDNPGIPLAKKVIDYDHAKQHVRTPYYYAYFRPNRFHFIRAGCKDFSNNGYIDLTNELRIEIHLKALWGLIPLRYTEENIICQVKRYKTGPLRLIRRGDFYLNLGLGIRGSRAAVNQLCYPQSVEVPVRVNLPFSFNRFFSEAFIEMTPILRAPAATFRFAVPGLGYAKELSEGAPFDTLIPCIPDKGYSLSDGANGFGWLMRIAAGDNPISGSGYIVRRPSRRGALAECGFRLVLRELPKGCYTIMNRVFFSRDSSHFRDVGLWSTFERATIVTSSGTFANLFGADQTAGPGRSIGTQTDSPD